ncbi:hypothetical protein C8A05DRAFT_42865 [Staphylotrichum tortipilum]|uniref:HNH nuclease domain-containing protein n=1 Tax=Staphylotrichum tortipilum TaxID=2831512 RepID=A0AAN6MN70_9PEZI|nr:hypothetical protein C8A05DRAFT_42865 [Staphylotrichum longicolle]
MHQTSLEGIINFQPELLLSSPTRDRARRRFYRFTDHFDVKWEAQHPGNVREYNRAQLLRLTYDHARSPLLQDTFLRAFFTSLELPLDGDGEDEEEPMDEAVRSKFFVFADYLINNFFLPLKASCRQTPQPSPAFHSAISRLQGGVEFAGTMERISALRGACLTRDRHRCVVTRKFDRKEALERTRTARGDACDDDGNRQNPAKQAALAILNMFDYGVGHLIEGVKIDRPSNALTLTASMHDLFGNFHVYFEPVPEVEPHTYRIETFLDPMFTPLHLPITRTLFLTPERTIEPPSPRLLAIHRDIARILHLSAAGEYIDEILWDMGDAGERGAQADGSTDLGRLVHLGLWLDGSRTCAY